MEIKTLALAMGIDKNRSAGNSPSISFKSHSSEWRVLVQLVKHLIEAGILP